MTSTQIRDYEQGYQCLVDHYVLGYDVTLPYLTIIGSYESSFAAGWRAAMHDIS